MNSRPDKPLGQKSYGTIPHLLGSKRGPGDRGVNEGQHRICTENARPHDRVIVQEKLDGTNVAVAKIDGAIVPLIRAGYRAETSHYEQHRLFAAWSYERQDVFDELLEDGQRLCGEWLAQAHGVLYDLAGRSPFVPFDLMSNGHERATLDLLRDLVEGVFPLPPLLHDGKPLPVYESLGRLGLFGRYGATSPVEGVVYRVERHPRKKPPHVDFLAKYVVQHFRPGRFLPGITDPGVTEPTWNWRPEG